MLPFAITANSITILRATIGTVGAAAAGITGVCTVPPGRAGQVAGPAEAAGPAVVEVGAAEAVAGAAVAVEAAVADAVVADDQSAERPSVTKPFQRRMYAMKTGLRSAAASASGENGGRAGT